MLLAHGHGRSHSSINAALRVAIKCGSGPTARWLFLDSRKTAFLSRTFATSRRRGVDTTPGVLHPPGQLGRYDPKAAPNPQARDIAVIGGGITGLSTAFHLSRDLPQAKITIYEQSDRVGGWIDSEHVKVNDGTVLFEWGPRTLRPDRMGNGMATLQLVGMMIEFEHQDHELTALAYRFTYSEVKRSRRCISSRSCTQLPSIDIFTTPITL